MLTTIVAHFNPLKWKSRTRNLLALIRQFADRGWPLLIVELSTTGEWEVPAGVETLRVTVGDVVWQKERLWQIGAEHLIAAGHEAMVFSDGDVTYTDPDWLIKTERLLNRYELVQPFSECTCRYTDMELTRTSAAKSFVLDGRRNAGSFGVAVAAHAEFIKTVGLYQWAIVGGGDTVMSLGMYWDQLPAEYVRHMTDILPMLNPKHSAGWWTNQWLGRAGRYIRGSVGFFEQHLQMMEHGRRADRKFDTRQRLLAHFSISHDITFNPGEGLRWAREKEYLEGAVKDYFIGRNEDAE